MVKYEPGAESVFLWFEEGGSRRGDRCDAPVEKLMGRLGNEHSPQHAYLRLASSPDPMEASVPAKARRGTGNLESVQNHCVPLLFLPRLALPNHDLAAFLYVSRARVKARPDVAKISTTRTKHPTYHAAHLSGQRLHITYSVLPRSRKSHCTFEVSLPTKNNCHHGAATN